ncbi:hypothetical protein [Psychromarinibacter sp. S121]|uniref:hypothetical protein n=1 Tax=Psychromarinibacter sp. S121 TaxID=3415127 RepID=UPI003C7C4647
MSDEGEIPITRAKALEAYGLSLPSLDLLKGELVYEEPVALKVTIMGRCRIGAYTYTGGNGMIRNTRIGRFCSIGQRLEIGHTQHPTDWVTSHPMAYDGSSRFGFHPPYREIVSNNRWRSDRIQGLRVTIGHDVWIGDRVSVTDTLEVGSGAVLALGALLNRSVPDYEIWGGLPARRLSARFRKIAGDDPAEAARLAAAMRRTEWWTRCPVEMRRQEAPLTDPKAFIAWFETHGAALPAFRPRTWRLARSGEAATLTEVTA